MSPLLPFVVVALASNQTSLESKIARILPKPSEERWLQIPWRTNLMAARREAQTAGKPLFLWVMVGNPQGCT